MSIWLGMVVHTSEFRDGLVDIVRSRPARASSETLSLKKCLFDTRFVETCLLCLLQRQRIDGSFILKQGPESPQEFAEELRCFLPCLESWIMGIDI